MREIIAKVASRNLLWVIGLLWGGMTLSTAHADGLSFRFSNDAIAFAYNIYPIRDDASAEFAWVHNNNDRDVVTAGFFVNGQRQNLSGRVGVKGYWADVRNQTGLGAAFGGDLNLTINELIALFAQGYWGPKAIAFDDLEGYEEWRIGANISIFDNSIIAVSYGSLEIDTERFGWVNVDEGLSVGLKMHF